MIADHLGRRFENLRVSLTAACNYACTYCVPNGKRLQRAKHELGADQLLRLVRLLRQATPINRVRVTGGEPLLSAKFDDFLLGLMQLPLDDVSLTTNGQFLLDKQAVIKESGIRRINISLDTLDPLRFRQIARGGDLATVLAGIDAMLALGLKVKVNMVPLYGKNFAEVVRMLDYCLTRGMELRFIELMRMGHLAKGGSSYQADFVSMQSLLNVIGEKYDYARTAAPHDSTAARFEIPGKGVFGVIANESEPFCRTCTRLRLSSAGHLYGCLSNSNRHYLAELLPLPEAQALAQLKGLLGAALQDKKLAFEGEVTVMKFIGG